MKTPNTKIVVSGKRKRSIARATIYPGNGKILINKQPYDFLPMLRKLMIEEPILIAKDVLGKFDYNIDVTISGGGVESGIEASRLAIARAIFAITKSKELKKAYVSYDRNMLIADTRRKEPYKPGDSKARSKRQKSYR